MVFKLPFTVKVKDLYKHVCISVFMLRFKANYLEKMRGYLTFSLWIPIALAKIYFFQALVSWRKSL